MEKILTLPSVQDSVETMERTTEDFLRELGYDADSVYKMGMAIHEAVNNAYLHGNKQDPNKKITLRLAYDGKNVTACVEDEDPDELRVEEHYALKEDLLATHGRGIHMMTLFTDELPRVEYVTDDGRRIGKRVYLVKKKPTSSL